MQRKSYESKRRELQIAAHEEAIRASRWDRWRKLLYMCVLTLALVPSIKAQAPLIQIAPGEQESNRKVVFMSFPIPQGLVRRTMKGGKPGRGAVINPTRIYVYPDGHGFLFFKNPIAGEEDVSVPFDGHYDAIVYLAGLLYEALKVAEMSTE